MKRFARILACLLFGVLVLAAVAGCSAGVPQKPQSTDIVSPNAASNGAAGSSGASNEPALTSEQRARQMLAEMSTEEKCGQLFMVYMPGKKAVSREKKWQYGGYVLFTRNFKGKTPAELRKLVEKCQKAANVGMFMAIDEEGGLVNRASMLPEYGHDPFSSPRALYASGGFGAVKADTADKAGFLQDLGLNTNFAPVADVPYSEDNYIYPRAFSTSAKKAARYVKTVVKANNKAGLACSLKHFPGYGANIDTHTSFSTDSRELSVFEKRDLLPFAAGIEAGAPMVMVNHNVVEAFDAKNPASISKKVHAYLRGEMGFTGIVISDGLGMAGVREFVGDDGEEAVRAIEAGNDMVCTGAVLVKTQLPAVVDAVESGRIGADELDEKVLRILECKLAYGIAE